MDSITKPLNAYAYSSGIWYFTRALARILAPETVFDWFRAGTRKPSDLELYNIRTDAFGLALCSLFVILLPALVSTSSTVLNLPPARLGLIGSIVQHAGTAFYAYLQWADSNTATGAMLLGWTVSSGLAALGLFALVTGADDSKNIAVKTRNGKAK